MLHSHSTKHKMTLGRKSQGETQIWKIIGRTNNTDNNSMFIIKLILLSQYHTCLLQLFNIFMWLGRYLAQKKISLLHAAIVVKFVIKKKILQLMFDMVLLL